MKIRSIASLLTLVAAASSASAGTWQVDPAHSAAQFSVKHLMVSTVRGQFQKMSGTVDLDESDMTKSKIHLTIDPSSIDTREPKRDAHLKSPDFFDVEKFPTMTFESTAVTKSGDGTYDVTGDLTMHGITHPVTLKVDGPTDAIKNPWGKSVRGVTATGTIQRKDWGLTWNKALEAGGMLVGDDVKLTIDAELDAMDAPAPAPAPAK
jgi:polyisoprenoid-binding protein YceI